MRSVNRSIAWPDAVLCVSAQPALFSAPKPSFPSLESEAGTSRWGDILSWQGTFGPRTTRPGGQLVLGPHVRGDSWSGGDTWSSYTVWPENLAENSIWLIGLDKKTAKFLSKLSNRSPKRPITRRQSVDVIDRSLASVNKWTRQWRYSSIFVQQCLRWSLPSQRRFF